MDLPLSLQFKGKHTVRKDQQQYRMHCISQLLSQAIAQGLSRIDAQMLMLHACAQTHMQRAWLIAHDQDILSPSEWTLWQQAVQRRLLGEPVAYILGFKEFYSLRLSVSSHVLDPRDDTETLVDWALELLPLAQSCNVLDLGTGSGAIALAIQAQRPEAKVTATEASLQALTTAQTNALSHQLPVRFVLTDQNDPHWLSRLRDERFDLIISNPPYIACGDSHLPSLRHEPNMALSSGIDGLNAIRSIVTHARAHLNLGGWLLLEHGFDQAERVSQLLVTQGFQTPQTRYDLAGQPRCTGAQT
jgi:release factor glutamine methyltransferase